MTTGGWIFMLTSVISVLSLTAWCFYRVMTTPAAAEDLHAPPTIDTGDEGT
jgi:hypothetical protein